MDQLPSHQKVKINPFHILIAILILIFELILLIIESQKGNQDQFTSADEIERISVEDAYKAVQKGEAVLVDTRPLSGYISMHAAGAISLPYDVVAQNQVKLRFRPMVHPLLYLSK